MRGDALASSRWTCFGRAVIHHRNGECVAKERFFDTRDATSTGCLGPDLRRVVVHRESYIEHCRMTTAVENKSHFAGKLKTLEEHRIAVVPIDGRRGWMSQSLWRAMCSGDDRFSGCAGCRSICSRRMSDGFSDKRQFALSKNAKCRNSCCHFGGGDYCGFRRRPGMGIGRAECVRSRWAYCCRRRILHSKNR